MDRLTPELWAISVVQDAVAATTIEEHSVALDFNLARRSAVVINQVRGFLTVKPTTTTGFDQAGTAIQELDVDPDNEQIFLPGGALIGEGLDLDSSRLFRQRTERSLDTAAGAVTSSETVQQMDWTKLPMEQRPISITNLRHNVSAYTSISSQLSAELYIKYFIVELSLLELGILNASRR